MGTQEELKLFMELIMEHSDDIEHLNLDIRMRNGNRLTYRVDRKKEEKLAEKERKREEKLAKIEAKKNNQI